MFDRLVGLETEYAIRFRARDASERPTNFQLYKKLLTALERRMPIVPARDLKEGVFTANGGAVWFERIRCTANSGLVEGATPECRGAVDAFHYQRAQDQLLSESARNAGADGEFFLLKNDRDSAGNVYGAQENYEVTLGSPLDVWLWRMGLIFLLPTLLLSGLATIGLILVLVAYYLLAGAVFVCAAPFLRAENRLRWQVAAFGQEAVTGGDTGLELPYFIDLINPWLARLILAPLAIGLILLGKLTVFRRVRRQLLPFLLSRVIIAGSGWLKSDGSYHIAAKGSATNCVIGLGGFLWDRPVFSFGHFAKQYYSVLWRPRSFARMFDSRQRLQVCIGDSNMAEEAEYLRLATTMLVLDAIEAGAIRNVPRVFRPIAQLRAFISTESGFQTALQWQWDYLNACKEYVRNQSNPPPAVLETLSRWEAVLDALESGPKQLVGRLDWVTKKYLLDEAGSDLSWEARKKIDLRYHELSPEGYYHQLEAAGAAEALVSASMLERALRSPPPRSPAGTRARYIREFAGGGQPLSVDWNHVVIGKGWRKKVITLASARQPTAGSQ